MAKSLRTRGCSSVVERDLAKVDVDGSNPFTRSIFNEGLRRNPKPFFRGVGKVDRSYIATCRKYFRRILAVFCAYPPQQMPRIATLTPSKDKKKNLWYVCIPADLSATGKWRREYFRSRDRARDRASELKRIRRDKDRFAAKGSPALIRDAVECDDLAQIYGFSGMREAFLFWSKNYGNSKTGTTFCQLLDAHEEDHAENWSHGYLTGRWRPFRKKMIPIENEMISLMDTAYWREWSAKWREESEPAPTT